MPDRVIRPAPGHTARRAAQLEIYAGEARAAIARVGGLVGRPELAEEWGVSAARVTQLTNDPTFPQQVGKAGQSRIWFLDEANAWRNRA